MKSFALAFVASLIAAACGKSGGQAAVGGVADPPEEGGAAADPVERDPSEGLVELTPEQVKSADLAIGKVEKRHQIGVLSATAELTPAADGVARIGSRLTGRVLSLKAGAGDLVKQGQVLAVVDASELGRAKADYLSALAEAQVTRESADRERALAEKKISSEKDWREAEAAATRARADKEAAENLLHTMGIGDGELARLKVVGHYGSTVPVGAPIDGTVVERPVTLGQMVDPKDTLFVIMDLRQVWILIDVYERDLAQVKIGQKVDAHVTAYRERVFTGTVQNIGAVVETKTRAVPVRVVLPNPDGALKPGMFATVELEGTAGEARDRLVVPEGAVQRDGDGSIVFVPRGAGTYARRAVRTGHASGGWIEVEEGLAEGEDVVIKGSFILKAQLKKGELGGEE